MAIKLTPDSFLAGIRQSGLVDLDRLDAVLRELKSSDVHLQDSEAIAEALVERELVTQWQVTKLLQGKFKGFILGRYRLLDLLGRGEMSSVYLAEHVMMKRRCAVKVLPAHRVKDTSYLGRFHREAEAVAALDHPNIVRAYDVGQEDEAGTEIHFLVMEYIVGKSLEKRLAEEGEFPIVEAVEYIRQGAEGLAHAHENGLVHRDIKPANLLINKKGVVKLSDLGLARFFKVTDEESLTIKHDEKVLGTADYLAPEQAVDSHAVDERADIYSLGCTLYFALTGQPPFTDGTLVQRLLAHQTKAPPPVQRLREGVPDSLAEILAKMMQKQPEDRFQTAAGVAEKLSQWLIDHADEDWKYTHPEIVARLQGIDAVVRPVATSQPEMKSVPLAVRHEPVIEPHIREVASEPEPHAPDEIAVKPEVPVRESRSSRKPARGRRRSQVREQQKHAEEVAAVDSWDDDATAEAQHRDGEWDTFSSIDAEMDDQSYILPGWNMAGIPINAKTALIAATLLAGMMLVFGFGYQMVAKEAAELVVPNYQGEFNLPGGNDQPTIARPH
ncbi:MAG: serine/threonine protein kinase [Planctomycetaceae bacterium]|nr:serine/threonine protein kinase [Planctomycetaceae bacterium]